MYKLEFGLPKFAMYKRVLAKVLAEQFVLDRGWSEERAVELGRRVLRQNVDEIFASRPRLAGGRAAAEADSRTQPPAVTGAELAAAGSESAGLAAALDTADEFRPAIASEAGLEAAGVAEPGDASGVELNDFAAEKSEEPPAATGAKAADSDVEDWLDAINRLSGPDTPRR
jgi:hypothetical protein